MTILINSQDQATSDLIAAVRLGERDATIEALERGAKIDGFMPSAEEMDNNIMWSYSYPPIVEAILGGHQEILLLLLKNNPNLDIPGEAHQSVWTEERALMALNYSAHKFLTPLLGAGLNPNVADPSGKTLLHLAIEMGWNPVVAENIVRTLLEHHADWRAKTIQGLTAEDFALSYLNAENRKSPSGLWKAYANAERIYPILLAVREQEILREICPEKQTGVESEKARKRVL